MDVANGVIARSARRVTVCHCEKHWCPPLVLGTARRHVIGRLRMAWRRQNALGAVEPRLPDIALIFTADPTCPGSFGLSALHSGRHEQPDVRRPRSLLARSARRIHYRWPPARLVGLPHARQPRRPVLRLGQRPYWRPSPTSWPSAQRYGYREPRWSPRVPPAARRRRECRPQTSLVPPAQVEPSSHLRHRPG